MKAIPERLAAIAAGEKYYFTGKPCRYGHVAKRAVANNGCAVCASKASQRWTEKQPEHPARIAARKDGQPRYTTGKPCRNGHHSERWTSSGSCIACSSVVNKRWKNAHPGFEAMWARKRRADNPFGHRAEVKRWKEKNPEKAKAILARWVAANPNRRRELSRIGRANRRTRQAKNGGRFTAHDIANLLAKQRSKCAGCGKRAKRLEIDHVVPVKHGGSSDPSNLQLLCRPCNRSKGARDAIAWAQSRGQLL